MLYWLSDLAQVHTVFNVFRYITFRAGGAVFTGLLFVFMFGPWIIRQSAFASGQGQPIREDGPQSHILTKKGTPTMGGLMILSGLLVSTLLWANLRDPYVWIVLGVTLGFGMGWFLRRLPQGHQAEPQRVRRADAADDRVHHHCRRVLRARRDRPPFAVDGRSHCRSSRTS